MNFIKAIVVCSFMLLSGIVLAQTGMKDIKGTICDESGEPIIGASVIVKGTSNGTISDLDGKFTLSVSDKAVIEISFVGYETQEIKMNTSKTDFKIVLRDDAELLEEVVVVGYGRKRIFNRSTKTTSVDGALQGRVAGLDTNSKKTTFGEREFRKYFEENRRTGICASGEFTLKARFRIDESGKAANIEVIGSDCDELRSEFLRLMEQSPLWTPKNREVSITLKIKN